MVSLEIHELGQEEPPWDLLLMADPSRERVTDYINEGNCFLAYSDDKLVGEFVLFEKSPGIMEIMNIAVAQQFQGKGVGKQLVNYAKSICKERGVRLLEVGTGNSSIGQIAFYQKCGFRIIGVERDFFARNYNHEIIENGIKCVDMLWLALELT